MKVEHQRTPVDMPVTRPEADPAGPAASVSAPAPAQPDSVKLSSAVQLADQALQAAQKLSDVRPAEVARAKALLERGELGNNLERLADSIIDSLLSQ